MFSNEFGDEFMMILRTVGLRHGNLHRFVNYDFNSDFKNRRFKYCEFT